MGSLWLNGLMKNLKVVVGLGNLGTQYQWSRHNAAWLMLDQFVATSKWSAFREEKKFQAEISRGLIDNTEIILVKPLTFMNLSGESVSKIVNFYKLTPATQLLLIYDDLDLNFGQVKLTKNSPHSHNGVLSVKQQLKTEDFWQIRLGVDDRQGLRTISAADYVLQDFLPAQRQALQTNIFDQVSQKIYEWSI